MQIMQQTMKNQVSNTLLQKNTMFMDFYASLVFFFHYIILILCLSFPQIFKYRTTKSKLNKFNI